MKKVRNIFMGICLTFAPFYLNAAACRCSVSPDSHTTINYSWTCGTNTASASVKVGRKQVATYIINVVEVPCLADVEID